MQIVFMGTPDFAVGALEALITQGHEITAVVTQAKGQKQRITVSSREGMCGKTWHSCIPAPSDQDTGSH